MQIIIDIPDRIHYGIEKGITINGSEASQIVLDAIKNGTPLPKGHGRLIDADALINSLGVSDRDIYCEAVIEEDAPTIIEADKAESEDKE